MEPEYREFVASSLTVEGPKCKSGGQRIVGHAAKFNSLSRDLGGFVETIKPGAFKASIASVDIRSLWNHQVEFVIGRTSSGTLKIWEDAEGLAFSVLPSAATWAQDLLISVARGDIRECSFGFTIPAGGDEWQRNVKSQSPVRVLLKVDLIEISVVSWAAYYGTSAKVREARPPSIAAELARRRARVQQLEGGARVRESK